MSGRVRGQVMGRGKLTGTGTPKIEPDVLVSVSSDYLLNGGRTIQCISDI